MDEFEYAAKRVKNSQIYVTKNRTESETREVIEYFRDMGKHYVLVRRPKNIEWEEVS